MSTREKILTMLRRGPLSIGELSDRLHVTRNAVVFQIRQLKAEGIVTQAADRHRKGVGKPSIFYQIAPGEEDVGGRAYKSFVLAAVAILAERVKVTELSELMDTVGRQLASEVGLNRRQEFSAGLAAAMAAADELGAQTEAVFTTDSVMVRSYSCPLGSAVRTNPQVCNAFASFFSEATESRATVACQRNERLICQYIIHKIK